MLQIRIEIFRLRTPLIRTVGVRKIPYALSFLIPFQNKTRENICLTLGRLVSLCRSQARAWQSTAVVRLIKMTAGFLYATLVSG